MKLKKTAEVVMFGLISLCVSGTQANAAPKWCTDVQKAFEEFNMGSGSAEDPQVVEDNQKATAYWKSLEKKLPTQIRKDWKVVAVWRASWTSNSVKQLAAWKKDTIKSTAATQAETEKLGEEQLKLASDPKYLAAIGRIMQLGEKNCA
jgi:hypothetical protein